MRKAAIGALAVGVLLITAGLRIAELRSARAATLDAAEARAANLSLVISAYLQESFAAGDASLRQLALHSTRVGGPAAHEREWGPSLRSAKAGLASIGAFSVVDRHGTIRHSTRPELVGQSRRDEVVLRLVFESKDDQLVIGTPFPTLATPPQSIIPIGRRLVTEDGALDGAVVASFNPALPRGFFRTVDVGEHGIVWVFHPDGVVLFREPAAGVDPGASAAANPLFAAAMRGPASSVLRGPLAAAGPELVSAAHRTFSPPFIVAVSLDQEEMLAGWRREVANAALAFGAVAVTLAATLFVLFRQMSARARVERTLAETQRLEAVRLREANERLAVALQREQQARQQAEAASALKDQFLMTVSHELRTPLTAIYGWSRMLVDGAVSDRQRDAALRTIERNAFAQTRLIDDLLDVAGVMGGKLRLDVHPVNLATTVHNAIDTVAPAAAAKGVRIETAIDPAASAVEGDPDRLLQIVWNLLSNAVKFTPKGGHVTVTVTRAGSEVEIAIADTGIGISPEFLPHVFERFRQEDGGTQRRYGGLGLGLAIVRSLVELHGGTIAARSDGPDRGAVFTVRLPAPALALPLGEGVPIPSATATDRDQGPPRLDGLAVLVVDDEPEARALFATILENAGATVSTAASADAALASLRERTPDVLVSDIEMPDVDGYALIGRALALAERRGDRLMAIAVTAYARPEDEARSLAAGFHRHLHKPVDPPALVAAVHAMARDTRRARDAV